MRLFEFIISFGLGALVAYLIMSSFRHVTQPAPFPFPLRENNKQNDDGTINEIRHDITR